jgi:hypothetical protein
MQQCCHSSKKAAPCIAYIQWHHCHWMTLLRKAGLIAMRSTSAKPGFARLRMVRLLTPLVMGAFHALVVVSHDAASTAETLAHLYVVMPEKNVSIEVDALQVTSMNEARASFPPVQTGEPEMNSLLQVLVDDTQVDVLPKETLALKAADITKYMLRFCKPAFFNNELCLLLSTQ